MYINLHLYSLTFSDPAGLAPIVHQSTVPVHEIGHVFRLGQRATRDGERLGRARDAQLYHALQVMLA